jgi:DinB superfamily
MDNFTKNFIWQQFGAAIDALENAINTCPEEVWNDRSQYHEYWYWTYHTLFWLDYYLADNHKDFKPPQPFTMSEFDPSGALPDHVYTTDELLVYLEHGRNKCRKVINAITDEWANQEYEFGKLSLSFAELLLYNMRHVQHHTAQLNMLLRLRADKGSGWFFSAKNQLNSE